MKNLRNTMTWKTDHEDFIEFLFYVGELFEEDDFTDRVDYGFRAICLLDQVAEFYDQKTYEQILKKLITTSLIRNKVLRYLYISFVASPCYHWYCKNLKQLRKMVFEMA